MKKVFHHRGLAQTPYVIAINSFFSHDQPVAGADGGFSAGET
jgi:hypothetical protein